VHTFRVVFRGASKRYYVAHVARNVVPVDLLGEKNGDRWTVHTFRETAREFVKRVHEAVVRKNVLTVSELDPNRLVVNTFAQRKTQKSTSTRFKGARPATRFAVFETCSRGGGAQKRVHGE